MPPQTSRPLLKPLILLSETRLSSEIIMTPELIGKCATCGKPLTRDTVSPEEHVFFEAWGMWDESVLCALCDTDYQDFLKEHPNDHKTS